MSGSTSAFQPSATPTPTGTLTLSESLSPLSHILPYLLAFCSLLLSSVLHLFRLLASFISHGGRYLIFVSPHPVLLYLLAPLTVFCQLLLDIFLRRPYLLACYLADALYPVYIFCGVACITGALLGVGGRALSQVLVRLALPAEQLDEDRRAAEGRDEKTLAGSAEEKKGVKFEKP